MVDPIILPDHHMCLFWGLEYHYHCDNIIVNKSTNMKNSFIVDTMESVESVVRDVLDILWFTPSSCTYSDNNLNTKLPLPNQNKREG